MAKKRFLSGKTYTHSTGHSCAFRQWRADSHCNLIHGYALQFELTFGSTGLDEKNWVVDFGGLKPLKQWLEDTFDHKVVLDADDPHLQDFLELENKGLAQITILDGVGAEKFALHAWMFADKLVREMTDGRCWCEMAECSEHGSNSAIFTPYRQQRFSFEDDFKPGGTD